jgi:hypothetical protein
MLEGITYQQISTKCPPIVARQLKPLYRLKTNGAIRGERVNKGVPLLLFEPGVEALDGLAIS